MIRKEGDSWYTNLGNQAIVFGTERVIFENPANSKDIFGDFV